MLYSYTHAHETLYTHIRNYMHTHIRDCICEDTIFSVFLFEPTNYMQGLHTSRYYIQTHTERSSYTHIPERLSYRQTWHTHKRDYIHTHVCVYIHTHTPNVWATDRPDTHTHETTYTHVCVYTHTHPERLSYRQTRRRQQESHQGVSIRTTSQQFCLIHPLSQIQKKMVKKISLHPNILPALCVWVCVCEREYVCLWERERERERERTA